MTTIIKIFLIDSIYLRREKNNIPINAIYVSKTNSSGCRLYC